MGGKKLWSSSLEDHDVVDMGEDSDDKTSSEGSERELVESPQDDIEDAVSGLELAQEASKTAFERLEIVGDIRSSLQRQNVCSAPYMSSLENYKPVLAQIMGNLRVNRSIPATEDFVNVRRAQSAHSIAMEGLGDFIRKAWEKIKEFFRLFFKKVMVFLKRLVKANLDLESYEKYLGSMMTKLKHNSSKAHPTDVKPFTSKLPVLLADEGMESMDAEYLMQYGTRKIERMVGLVNRFSGKGIGRFNESDGLPRLYAKIQEFIKANNNPTGQSIDTLTAQSNELRDLAAALLQTGFEHKVNHANELPDEVYSRMHDAFDRSADGEIDLFCLHPNNATKNSLPKDVNMFLAIAKATKSTVVTGHVYDNIYVRQTINPPSTFNGLQQLYDYYKTTVSKVNVRNMDNAIDKTNDHVIKILNLMSKDFSALMDKIDTMRSGAVPSNDLAGALIWSKKTLIENNRNTNISIFLDSAINSFEPQKDDESLDKHRRDILHVVTDFNIGPYVNGKQHKAGFISSDLLSSFELYLSEVRGIKVSQLVAKIQEDVRAMLGQSGTSVINDEELEKRREIIKDLNRVMTNLLNNLQSVVRLTIQSIHAVYTEIRYEYVRYLYMSAQRYGIER